MPIRKPIGGCVRLFSFFEGVFRPSRESDYTAVGISKGLGSTGCEAAMPVFGANELRRRFFLCPQVPIIRTWREENQKKFVGFLLFAS